MDKKLIESLVRRTLFTESKLSPKNGETVNVEINGKVVPMKVSGVEYDDGKDSLVVNGIVNGKPQFVYSTQIVESIINEKEYKDNEDDKVAGGLADGMSLEDIAGKHKVKLKYLKKQFDMGVEIEMEHTNDYNLAKEIAKDHLFENPKYYDDLQDMEDEAEEEMEESLDLDGLSPEKWMKEVKTLDLTVLSPDDLQDLVDEAGEVEQYLRRKANNAQDVRTSRRYFNDVEWLEDNLF